MKKIAGFCRGAIVESVRRAKGNRLRDGRPREGAFQRRPPIHPSFVCLLYLAASYQKAEGVNPDGLIFYIGRKIGEKKKVESGVESEAGY